MHTCDISKLTFDAVKASLTGRRLRVYDGFRIHGPCTTRELSDLIQLSILSVRPRATELLQLGLITCVGCSKTAPEGLYIAIAETQARELFAQKHKESIEYAQPQLKLV